MKYSIKKQEKDFRPIEVTITLESKEELCGLLKRLNPSIEIIEGSLDYLKGKGDLDSSAKGCLFIELDDILQSYENKDSK
jgi:hypothetical protein